MTICNTTTGVYLYFLILFNQSLIDDGRCDLSNGSYDIDIDIQQSCVMLSWSVNANYSIQCPIQSHMLNVHYTIQNNSFANVEDCGTYVCIYVGILFLLCTYVAIIIP